MTKKNWICKDLPESEIDRLAQDAGVSRLVAAVLLSRGISDVQLARKFLNPSLEDMADPFLLKDMDRAVECIAGALDQGEKITVYGDYDVDGITSTSLLFSFLREAGANVDWYIPDRLEEGYGLSAAAIDRIRLSGTQLIVTVDCGITALEEVAHAKGLGMKIVVTDHHECREGLPSADAVVNPHRSDSEYPFRELAGAGVALKLVHAFCLRFGMGRLHENYLDLAALATIADVVPLVGENRIIAKFGLEAIEKSGKPGIVALLEVTGLRDKPVNTYAVGFGIAPRINAAGRIGDAGRAVRLFTTSDRVEANRIADELNEENKNRQDIEGEILRQALEIVGREADLERERVIIAAGEGWHHGIIGIVSSKITDRYYRPSILFSIEDGICKGSGRSIEGFNLFKALIHCEGLLERFGGHELAAGLSLKEENLPTFRRVINEYAEKVMRDEDLVPKIRIDAFAGPADLSMENAAGLEKLAPFGSGNPGPVLAFKGFTAEDVKTVGEGKHLKLRLRSPTGAYDAIGFGMGNTAALLSGSDSLETAFSLEINCWNNTRKVQLNLKDIRPEESVEREKLSEQDYYIDLDKNIVFDSSSDYNIDISLLKGLSRNGVEDLIPGRQDIAAVYQYIRGNCGGNLETHDLFALARLLSEKTGVNLNYFKLSKSIQILKELGLLSAEAVGRKGVRAFLTGDGREKTSLEKSVLYRRLQELGK